MSTYLSNPGITYNYLLGTVQELVTAGPSRSRFSA